jgi:arylsulfatase A-like enzyme
MSCTRREFLCTASAAPVIAAPPARRPNVVLIITDDQGYGDLSLHGNPHLKTPNIDAIGRDGVQFTQFQVSPVCSPTRSSLLTGRYNYRTGVVDTFLGRSMMYPDEVTIAEVLSKAGYRTGIFGKWHLGDNYPMRAMDQGFQETLVHKGGGIGQASDPPGSSYFDPILFHNGRQEKFRGYCTDVFFDAATSWIETNRNQPFFAYIATNAPHSPLLIDNAWVEPFRKQSLQEDTAKIYGMVANIDKNIGHMLAKMRALDMERDTLLIFMTDNGPYFSVFNQDQNFADRGATYGNRFNAGMRGGKASVYQGGIRVPFFLRWPARLPSGRKVDRATAHIDIFATVLEACGVSKPDGLKLDGRSILASAEGKITRLPDRMLFTQWHRGDQPEPFRNCAVRTQQYKLVDGKELYDLAADPSERQDIAANHPHVVARLRRGYEEWLQDVSSVRRYVPPRIYIGTPHENPVTLTRQDWRVPSNLPASSSPGWWEVDVKRAGHYDVTVAIDALKCDGKAHFQLGAASRTVPVAQGASECRLGEVPLTSGPAQLKVSLECGGSMTGARFVEIRSS